LSSSSHDVAHLASALSSQHKAGKSSVAAVLALTAPLPPPLVSPATSESDDAAPPGRSLEEKRMSSGNAGSGGKQEAERGKSFGTSAIEDLASSRSCHGLRVKNLGSDHLYFG
jgi:hypothetical protein